MQVKYINSATVIVENNGIQVLCDPWLLDGAYYGSWCHYPPLEYVPEDFSNVDYIYISHVHPDHMHVDTLKRFPKNIPILIHAYEHRFLRGLISLLGFTNIIEISHKQVFELGKDFNLEILAADDCDPEKCGLFMGCNVGPGYTKTLNIDTMAVFNCKDKTIVNTNDCPYDISKEVCDYIKNKYKNIDILLVGYLGAGPFPQCFSSLSDTEKEKASNQKKYNFYQQTINFILKLQPRLFIPFAGKYTLGGKLISLNKWRGNPEQEELLTDFLPFAKKQNIDSIMVVLNRGSSIEVNENDPKSDFKAINSHKKNQYMDKILSKKRFSYHDEEVLNKSNMVELLNKAQDRKLSMQNTYNFYSDWNVYLDINKDFFIKVPYTNEKVTLTDKITGNNPWVKIILEDKLLTAVMNKRTHWNNMEIGSHLLFERSKNQYVRGIHHYLSFFHA
jgi:UDP-MurNAc hydroxylase